MVTSKNIPNTISKKESESNDQTEIDSSFMPIGSALADADEKYKEKTSALERIENVVFAPQPILFRTPTATLIQTLIKPDRK